MRPAGVRYVLFARRDSEKLRDAFSDRIPSSSLPHTPRPSIDLR